MNKHIKSRPIFKIVRKTTEPITHVQHPVLVAVGHVNIIGPIFKSLLCNKLSHGQRMITGVVVMASGVAIAKFTRHHPSLWVAGMGDMFGYAVHGVGLTPFAVFLSEKFEMIT